MYRLYSYGYGMVNGEISILTNEAEIVKQIFDEYIEGMALKDIASKRIEDKVVFYNGICNWHKGTIYRIIMNEKYIGGNGYPKIISNETFKKANDILNKKLSSKKQASGGLEIIRNKIYCGQCGKIMGRRARWGTREKWICNNGCKTDKYVADKDIIDGIFQVIRKINKDTSIFGNNVSENNYEETQEIIRYNNEIKRLINTNDFSFNIAKKLILDCANLKFQSCKANNELIYSDYVLKKTKEIENKDEISAEYINETAKRIKIDKSGDIIITYKNGFSISNDIEEEDNAKSKGCNQN